jgi:hypothetical protein
VAEQAGRLVYRPALPRALAVGYLLFGGWLLLGTVTITGPVEAVGWAGMLVGAGSVGYAVLWRPAVVVDTEGVLLINMLRTVKIPWAVLDAVDTRYALTLTASGRRYVSWAAGAPGRRAAPWPGPGPGDGAGGGRGGGKPWVLPDRRWSPTASGVDRASRDLRSGAGAAAFMVEQGWLGWRDRPGQPGNGPGSGREPGQGPGRDAKVRLVPDGGTDPAAGAEVRVRWDRRLLVVGSVGFIAGTLTLALG